MWSKSKGFTNLFLMQKGFANHLNRFQCTEQEMYIATFNVQRSSYVYIYHSYFIYACFSVCAVIAVLIFWDWSIHSWNKDGWLSKDSNGPWWKPNNRGKIEWSTVFFPYFLSLFISTIGAGQCLQPVFLCQFMLRNANVGPTSAPLKMWSGLPKDATETWQQFCIMRLVIP